MRQINSPFGQNVFIVNHKRKHLFVSTAKSGCTTLKYLTVIDDELVNNKINPQNAHEIIGYKSNDKTLISTSSKKYPNYTRFAVLRDPVERFISWYSDKVTHPYQPYVFLSGLAKDQSIDRCLAFLEYELTKSDSEWMDEHVRPQSMYFDPDDIDIFVYISDLSKYLRIIGVKRSQRSSNKGKTQNIKLTKEQMSRFKALYASDYKLLETVKDKVWRPK